MPDFLDSRALIVDSPRREWAKELTSHTGILQSLHDWVAMVCREVEAISDQTQFAFDCQLGISELMTNIIKYAYGAKRGRIVLQAREYADRMEFEIRDEGLPFDVGTARLKGLPAVREQKYGLLITRSVMDDVRYSRTSDAENRWLLVKKFQGA